MVCANRPEEASGGLARRGWLFATFFIGVSLSAKETYGKTAHLFAGRVKSANIFIPAR
jgi:hypothetical protein